MATELTHILELAEKNARNKDLEIENEKFKQDHNEISRDELEKAMEIMAKATGKELYIGTKKSPQSKVRFVQLIQDNWNYALETEYLTDEEMLFLIRIQRFLQFKSNCIVDDIHSRNAIPMSQTQIAERLGTSKPKVSRILKQLERKGIVVKAVSRRLEGSRFRTNAIFINPNIMFSGDRDNIEITLKALFINSKPLLKKFPVALF
ncbi:MULTISPECIES: helix-turn-helix domain-containing protein [Bacillus cereus group]|nr:MULTISPECIES: helix-turn-helix domain-containing protein [Bacillus cereus group]EJQ19210.1 hypothetical protein IE9_05768 [Bacillus cereus BAG4X12-1]EOP77585.1 hypothetical protein IEG_05646 [Bacillus cereus BAG5X12-1]MEB9366881.1 helix-turn-helix domain-containing protein [Bacillus cereus]PER63082.1 transcriptional regulator [Bacillus cereus]PES46007.1 transcriptional regulator [Bacillus cereus]